MTRPPYSGYISVSDTYVWVPALKFHSYVEFYTKTGTYFLIQCLFSNIYHFSLHKSQPVSLPDIAKNTILIMANGKGQKSTRCYPLLMANNDQTWLTIMAVIMVAIDRAASSLPQPAAHRLWGMHAPVQTAAVPDVCDSIRRRNGISDFDFDKPWQKTVQGNRRSILSGYGSGCQSLAL